MHQRTLLFGGTANPALTMAVAQHLGAPIGECHIERFPDGETAVEIRQPVRGRQIYLIQPTAPPVDENFMQLLLLVDACRRAAASRIMAIIPYYGYARADKRNNHRVPITASLTARLIEEAGVDHIVTIDPHTPQMEGFFHGAVDSLSAVTVLAAALRSQVDGGTVIVSPDAGRVKTASQYASLLNAPVAVLHKQRESGTQTVVTHVVGDVCDRRCIIVDDMISTGGTIRNSVESLLAAGALPEMTVVATHGLLSAGAREKLDHPAIQRIVVTDTVAVPQEEWPQVEIVSVAPLLATAIQRFAADSSISDLG